MIRVLIFFAFLFLVTLGVAWLSDLPGVISITWQGYVWEQPPVVVVLMAGLGLLAILLALWLVMSILRSPKLASRFFRRRRREKGYRSLSQGLLALGAGNPKLARKYGVDADKLLRHEPATKLLLAQTAQLAGKHEEARDRYEAMLEDDETKSVGLHGLFIEAEREGEPVAARHYAEEASQATPGLEWAGKAVLGYQAVSHDWEKALATLERNYTSKLLDKKTYRRQRAVILTALAQDLEQGEPDRAYSLAREAHGLALDLVPATVLAARLATRKAEIRKASKLIESTWRVSPHPDLAEAYAHVRSGDSAVDRLKRVKSLAGQKANSSVGELAVARAAIEAREFDEAREALKKVLRSETSRSAFVMMAELEEAEHGDRGRMREWLARAVRAPQDKAWIADGIVSREWQPVSPVTGKLDAFEWATPAGMSDESELLEDAAFDQPGLPVLTPNEAVGTAAAAVVVSDDDAPVVEATPVVDVEAAPVSTQPTAEGAKAPAMPAGTKPSEAAVAIEPTPVASKPTGVEGTTDDVREMKRPHDLLVDPKAAPAAQAAAQTPASASASPAKAADDASHGSEPVPTAADKNPTAGTAAVAGETSKESSTSTSSKGKDGLNQRIEFPLERMPDDPGLDDDPEEDGFARPPRSRFFN
ncbi:heme biosynthesis protein HemY [Roseibium sp. CAU 1637]|uniref:Heme biosynthesis protein HemY n=1 Tax=Roseibium limicola TaxID=2816037 RepID=A0A939ERE5_9HYPH|nr:heme biosynthesis HemY N-terminal domain-containing protein [Roseibium limicola]MBO0346576.1 heme biosynthesis protein HemY [Roseibium limicola]